MGQGENAENQHFLLFPKMFSTLPKMNKNSWVTFILLSASSFKLDQSKNKSFGKGVKYVFWKCRNQCEKRWKFLFLAFSPFPTMFSKGFFLFDSRIFIYTVSRICFLISKPHCLINIVWLNGHLTYSHTMTPFDAPGKQAFWKHCGKRRNCS